MAPPPHNAAEFHPNPDCTLVKRGLSGPGVYAVGETPAHAKQQLARAETVVYG